MTNKSIELEHIYNINDIKFENLENLEEGNKNNSSGITLEKDIDTNSDSIIDDDSDFQSTDEIISKNIDNIEIYLSNSKYEKVKFDYIKNDIKNNY